jgi:hypothetical protein
LSRGSAKVFHPGKAGAIGGQGSPVGDVAGGRFVVDLGDYSHS